MKKFKTILVLVFILACNYVFSQKADSTNTLKADTNKIRKAEPQKKNFYLKSSITITNKGISYIPNLSLGKPAVLFDLTLGREKLSFEPQLRFALNGEPWALLFPVRYKIKSKGKFQMTAGINPLFNFKTVTYTVNTTTITDLVNRRYLGGEFKPNYFFTKSISAGMVYLYFYGLSDRAVKNTHFVSFNINLTNIKFGKKFFAKFNPQVYYLYQDGKEGYYFNSVLTFLRRDFPLSVQTILNMPIQTNIPGSQDLLWNVSLIYSFSKTYVPK